ncbi:MAG: RNA methyltransferase [Casimicrobiaceae bacterium]
MKGATEPIAAKDGPGARSDALARIRIVLCAPSHPGNVGAAARAMRTMGLARLTLVAPLRFPDPEADALASGATAILRATRVVATLDAALVGATLAIGFSARPREFAGAVLPVRAAAHEALRYAERGDVALVFGSEMSGLSNAELARCQLVATIPSDLEFSSLNLAAAVQVATYELRVAAAGDVVWRAPAFEPASQDEIARLFEHGERTLIALDFLRPAHPKRLLPRLRRLFARARLEKEEVNILRGILARIDERLQRARKGGG